MPSFFPDWVPWWLQLVLFLLFFVAGVAFLLMPFAVFGVKGRLEEIELQLGEIQAELRVISLRMAPGDGRILREDVSASAGTTRSQSPTDRASGLEDGYRAAVQPAPTVPKPTRFDPPPAPEGNLPRSNPAVRPDMSGAPRHMPWHEPESAAPSAPAPVQDGAFFKRDDLLKRTLPVREQMLPEQLPGRDVRDDYGTGRDAGARPRSEPTLRWPPAR